MLNHIGLQYKSKKDAEIFFAKVLEIPKIKEFTISSELGETIFGIKREVEVVTFGNDRVKFEVFIAGENLSVIRRAGKGFSYEHICLEVSSKEEFIARCKNYGIEPKIIRKEGKDLLFITDFSGYLYEIKEG